MFFIGILGFMRAAIPVIACTLLGAGRAHCRPKVAPKVAPWAGRPLPRPYARCRLYPGRGWIGA